MDTNVIRWKLNEVMARKRIRNKDLAQDLGITETSIYRLRKTDDMPRLSPERLNGLCAALKCQPGELLEWVPDDDSNQGAIAKPTSLLELSTQTAEQKNTQHPYSSQHTCSLIAVIPKVAESA